jgi:hypothetical protein
MPALPDVLPSRGLGVYTDTPGSPPLASQLDYAKQIVGPGGSTILFLLLSPNLTLPESAPKIQDAYDRGLRVVVRLGWKGAMRDLADQGSSSTSYKWAAAQLANVVSTLPLPPEGLGPLLVHAGNELNACNEWRCTAPSGKVLDMPTRVREVGAFMSDVMEAFEGLSAVRSGSMKCAHASIADWQYDGCECGTNKNKGQGRPGIKFLEGLVRATPTLYDSATWISSHSYPFSNANYSIEPSSDAFRGLTYYRAERAAVNRSAAQLPAVITETGWARNGLHNRVSALDQALWTRRAWEEIWVHDTSVLSVLPFLLGGRFWESRGRNWFSCPPGTANIDAPCDGPLTPWPVVEAWQNAGRGTKDKKKRALSLAKRFT